MKETHRVADRVSASPDVGCLENLLLPPFKSVRHIPTRINGKDVKVRKNLWLALLHLCPDNDIRYIWIDALCIN